MSTVGPTTRRNPRWSVDRDPPRAALLPASIAGLPAKGTRFGVGPPLAWSGPSFGSSGVGAVPIWLPFTPLAIPVRAASPIRMKLLAPAVTAPRTSGAAADPEVLLPATIVLLRVNVTPAATLIPPALLPAL